MEYAKSLSESAEVIVREDRFGKASVVVKKIKANGSKRYTFLDKKAWDGLKRLAPRIAQSESGVTFHLRKLKVVLSTFRDVDYVGLVTESVQKNSTFSTFLVRAEWERLIGGAKNIEEAIRNVEENNKKKNKKARLSAPAYRWCWYAADGSKLTGYDWCNFSKTACKEEGIQMGPDDKGAELVLESHLVDVCDPQALVDALGYFMCWNRIPTGRKNESCQGCLVGHPSQDHHTGHGGCLEDMTEALYNGDFEQVYETLDWKAVKHVYTQAVKDMRLDAAYEIVDPEQTMNKETVAAMFLDEPAIFTETGRPYQNLFDTHWGAYLR